MFTQYLPSSKNRIVKRIYHETTQVLHFKIFNCHKQGKKGKVDSLQGIKLETFPHLCSSQVSYRLRLYGDLGHSEVCICMNTVCDDQYMQQSLFLNFQQDRLTFSPFAPSGPGDPGSPFSPGGPWPPGDPLSPRSPYKQLLSCIYDIHFEINGFSYNLMVPIGAIYS